MKIPLSILVAVIGFLASSGGLTAQDSRLHRLDQPPPPGTATNMVAAAAGQVDELDDLGPELMLARRPKPTVFEVSADTQCGFDSNLLLTPSGQLSAGELSETLAVAASPRLVPGLTTTVYANQQFVRYSAHTLFDFDAQTAGLSLSHAVGSWGNLYGGLSANRLCAPVDTQEFFKEYDTVFGGWRGHSVGRRLTVYYGYQFDWMPTHPSALTRIYNAGYGGLNVKLTDQLLAQLLYRLRAQDYLQSKRSDFDHTVNLTLTYTVNQFIVARIYGSYGDSSSNESNYDYRSLTGGGGLTLILKF